MFGIKQEKSIVDQPIPVSLDGMKEILSQMEKRICIICQENGGEGTGFFCKIPFENDYLPVLITNNHILNEKDIENGKIINLMINGKRKKIEIDKSRKKFTKYDQNIDITIIEIKTNKDGIDIDNFLDLDEKDIYKDIEDIELIYRNKSIYILHYPNKTLYVSYGIIKNIKDNKKIEHKCNTLEGSSGSPILSLETFKVIGIHCGCYPDTKKLNIGIFIKYVIDIFNNFKTNKNEMNKIVNENIIKKKEKNELVKNNGDYNYKLKTEPNPGKISDKINSKENNHRLNQIKNINKNDNNIMKDKGNTLSNNNNNQIKSKSLGKKTQSNNILDDRNCRNPNNRNNLNPLNRRGNLDLVDEKGNSNFWTEKISSKETYSNEKKKKINLKMGKENSEIKILSNRNLERENQLVKDRVPLIQDYSDKNEKNDEKRNSIIINHMYKHGINSKKEYIKINDYIKNVKKNNENDINDRNNKNRLNLSPSFDEKNKYKKVIYRKDNHNKLYYQISK